MEDHGNQWCKKHKKSLPKPGSHDACIQGAHSGAVAAHKYVSYLKKEYARKLEEEPEETKKEVIKEMELAAELEEQQVKKAARAGKPIVAEEVRAQAEAAVEEIKEEVKQGKTDLDLAREAARAAFKAKQASEEEAVEEIDL
jgi:MinD-like ATPase involved in chromosome partitioning or flagellar assembly